jgi:phage head maturation protease
LTIRIVKKISRLYDVSVVTFPAYPQTSSQVRSNAEILSERKAAPSLLDPHGTAMLRRRLELAYYGTY